MRSHAEGVWEWKCIWIGMSRPWGGTSPSKKGGRPQGRRASSPAEVADQTGRVLAERAPEWLERLTTDPASFAAVDKSPSLEIITVLDRSDACLTT